MWRRDVNIVYSYLAFWLPVLLLINRKRFNIVRHRLRDVWVACSIYLLLQCCLVMYGGTNLMIFVSYSLPVALLVYVCVLKYGGVTLHELVVLIAVVFIFNRNWQFVPLPNTSFEQYLDFLGGYNDFLTRHSFARMIELAAWLIGFWTVRALLEAYVRCATLVDSVHA